MDDRASTGSDGQGLERGGCRRPSPGGWERQSWPCEDPIQDTNGRYWWVGEKAEEVMAIRVVLTPCDLPTSLWFIEIQGVPGSYEPLLVAEAKPREEAERLKARIEEAFTRFPEPIRRSGKTAWARLALGAQPAVPKPSRGTVRSPGPDQSADPSKSPSRRPRRARTGSTR